MSLFRLHRLQQTRTWASLSGILIGCALLLFAPRLSVQAEGPWNFRHWQSRDGLPENAVQAFAQTDDGFLWVGTSGGLARFDGQSFEVFDHGNTPAFKESNIPCLLVTRDRSLWVCTDGGGLMRWQNGTFKRYGAAQGLDDSFAHAIFEDREGTLWVGTPSGLFRWKGDAAGVFERISSLDGVSVRAVTQTASGQLLLGSTVLYSMDHGRIQSQPLGVKDADVNVRALLTGSNGEIWVGCTSGLWHRSQSGDRFERVRGVRGPVSSLDETRDGALVIGTSGDGVYVWRNDHLTHVDSSETRQHSAVLAVFQDHDGNIWSGTQAGMLQMTESPIEIVHLPEPSNLDFGTVYLDKSGTLWVASRTLFRVRNNVVTPYSLPALRGAYVLNVVEDEMNTLWLGTNGSGVFHVTPQGIMHYTVANGLANNFIRIMSVAHDGSIWIGTDAGVSHLKGGKFRNYSVKDGLCNATVQAIAEDPHHQIWIGTAHGLSHMDGDRFVDDAATRGLKEEKVWSTYIMPDGSIWIGTRSGGLYQYEDGRLNHFTAADGLGTDSIYKLLGDRFGYLWMSGPSGIVKIRLRELRDHAKDPSVEIAPQFYYIFDRGAPVQLFGGIQSGGVIGHDGDVWFPSDHGPVHILPQQQRPPPPHLRIKTSFSDGQQTGNGGLRLAADSTSLEIQYAPILLTPQAGMRYRYRLEGLDKEWVSSRQRTAAYFTNIPAGRYTFRVQGYFSGHPTEYAEATLVLVKAQHFYRTWWFLSLLLLCLALLAWSAYTIKVRRVKARFHVILDERVRLAREMHDTVLQGCASVSSLLEASSNAEDDPAQRQALMDCARGQIAATMDEARRAVWNLRNTKDPSVDLRCSLTEMIGLLRSEFGREIECDIEDKLPWIDPGTAHEIVMVAREALHNALLHANAKHIALKAVAEDMRAVLFISDDGSGFDLAHPVPSGHYGLAGMSERIHHLGGEFEIYSEPGAGTSVAFTVRLNAVEREARAHG